MAYKILLTEQRSDLAKELLADLEAMTFQIITPDLVSPVDTATNMASLLAKQAPNIIVNSLSYLNPELDITTLCALFKSVDATVIHVSSHEVFAPSSDGRPYLELDLPNGSGLRAEGFIAAELAIGDLPRHIILRLPAVVSAASGNWLDHICRALMLNEPVPVSETQRLDPLCVTEASRVLIALVQQILCGAENWGVLHLHTADACSEAEVSDHIGRLLRKEQIEVASLDASKRPSERLVSAGLLGGGVLTSHFGVQMRSWRLGLRHQLMRWLEQNRVKSEPV